MNKRRFNQHMKKLLTAMSIAAVSAVSSLAIAQQAPDAAEADTSLRLEALSRRQNSVQSDCPLARFD
jgi:hypothetical protein